MTPDDDFPSVRIARTRNNAPVHIVAQLAWVRSAAMQSRSVVDLRDRRLPGPGSQRRWLGMVAFGEQPHRGLQAIAHGDGAQPMWCGTALRLAMVSSTWLGARHARGAHRC